MAVAGSNVLSCDRSVQDPREEVINASAVMVRLFPCVPSPQGFRGAVSDRTASNRCRESGVLPLREIARVRCGNVYEASFPLRVAEALEVFEMDRFDVHREKISRKISSVGIARRTGLNSSRGA